MSGIIAGNIFSINVIDTSLTPASVATITTSEQTFTVNGVKVGDQVAVSPPGITTGVILCGARVSATNTVALQFVNPTAGSVTPAAGVHRITVIRAEGSVDTVTITS